jgi:hypothetical protein
MTFDDAPIMPVFYWLKLLPAISADITPSVRRQKASFLPAALQGRLRRSCAVNVSPSALRRDASHLARAPNGAEPNDSSGGHAPSGPGPIHVVLLATPSIRPAIRSPPQGVVRTPLHGVQAVQSPLLRPHSSGAVVGPPRCTRPAPWQARKLLRVCSHVDVLESLCIS